MAGSHRPGGGLKNGDPERFYAWLDFHTYLPDKSVVITRSGLGDPNA